MWQVELKSKSEPNLLSLATMRHKAVKNSRLLSDRLTLLPWGNVLINQLHRFTAGKVGIRVMPSLGLFPHQA